MTPGSAGDASVARYKHKPGVIEHLAQPPHEVGLR